MPEQMQIFRSLEQVARDAGSALSRTAQPWMFDRADWFQLAAKHTLEGTPLVIKAQNHRSQCWLFLDQKARSAYALGNWYCLRYGVVTEGSEAPYDKLIDGVRAAGVGHLFIDPLGGEDKLIGALRRRGWLTRQEKTNVSWRIDTAGMSFDEYWAERPSRLRNTAKRKARKANLDCRIFKSFDAVLWAHVCDVFDNSWKKPDGTPELTRDLFQQEAEAGTLRLGLAYRGEQPVAAQLWTVERGVAIIHLLSYREDAKQLGAGTVLSYEMFRHVLDVEHVDMIDFGIGDHPYKQEWMTYSVPLYSLTAYDLRSLPGLIEAGKMAWRKVISLLSTDRGAGHSGEFS